ncbi:PAS domain-containing sensor histidine kinase [Spirulina subsalsa]|uniref:PAS domain-containing sensor histidine kinase n=1 Tax=Spirulina subsalsa TaxID=54311 RepID=UPI0002FE59A7|nr:PAS domain S-box protein [Spirulina subsalsa]
MFSSLTPAKAVAFETLFNGALDAMLIADDHGVYINANPAACQLLGKSQAELMGCTIEDFTLEEFDFPGAWQKFLEKGQERGEIRLRAAHSEIRDVEYAATAHIQPHYHLSILRDITARKRAEAQRQELEKLLYQSDRAPFSGDDNQTGLLGGHCQHCNFRQLIENLNDMVFTLDLEGHFSYISPAFQEVMGYKTWEMEGKHFSPFVHPDDLPVNLSVFAQVLAGDKIRDIEYRVLHQGGDYHWHSANLSPLTNAEGKIVACLGIARDIQGKQERELQLQQLSRELNKAQEVAHIGHWSFHLPSQSIHWSEEVFRIFGMTPDQKEPNWEEYLQQCHPEDCQHFTEVVQEALQGHPQNFEHRIRRPGGEVRYLNCRIEQDYEDSKIVRLFGTVLDITEQKRAEAERESAFQALFNIKYALDQAAIVAITDPQGRIQYVNDKFSELCGYSAEEIVGKTHRVINSGYHPPEFFQALWKTISREQVWHGEICNQAKQGNLYWVDTTIVPLMDDRGNIEQYLSIRFDITEQKRSQKNLEILLEKKAQLYLESEAKTEALKQACQKLSETQLRLVQAEKMSSLGHLVAGIAHEINNPVSFIYGNLVHLYNYGQDLLSLLELYQDYYPNPPAAIEEMIEEVDLEFIREDFPKILRSLESGEKRLTKIVQSLRTFSRLDEAEFKTVDLHSNIDSALVILQSRCNLLRDHGKTIEVVKNYGDLPPVKCYSGLLNQALMNLLLNGVDAIEERIKQETDPHYVGRLTITTAIQCSQVMISIQDNGIGISATVQEKIFNPFFTTKPVGMGTGMGLPLSYQVITQQHQGTLTMNSHWGEGSEFVIKFPQNLRRTSISSHSPAMTGERATA